MFKDIEDFILKETKCDLDKIAEITAHLASLDWQSVMQSRLDDFIIKALKAHERWNTGIQRGGGLCDKCDQFCDGYDWDKLYCWPHTVNIKDGYLTREYHLKPDMNKPRYCYNCFRKEQYDLFKGNRRELNGYTMEFAICETCRRVLPIKAGYTRAGDRGYPITFCLDCAPEDIENRLTICSVCKKKVSGRKNDSNHICPNCRSNPHWNTVWSHLARAKNAGTPATLTTQEWAATLRFFKETCAYCRSRQYQVLEHFIPISRGGGTTANNCVPACKSCNSRKGSASIKTLCRFFDPLIIDNIKSYLAGGTEKNIYQPTGQELIIWEPSIS